jgi:HSP20 family protein
MSDIEVKKQQSSETANEQKGLERSGSRGVSRGRGWDPFSFSLMPSDFFSADPFSFMRRFQEEMDRRTGHFFGGEGRGAGAWNPAIEVAERNGQLQVHAELPGLKPEDVKVELTDDALIIEGERKYEHEDREGGVYRTERHYGKFYREIPLPEGAHAADAKAQFRDGVLEVTLPVPEQKRNRRSIPIDSGASSEQKGSEQKGKR